MPEPTGRNIVKHAGEIKENGKVASAFCGLQTSIRNKSVAVIEIERHLTVWIEVCNQKRLPLSRAAIRTKGLNLFKRAKGKNNEVEKSLMHVLVCLSRLKIEFSCIMLKLRVREPVQMTTQHLNILII
jgi:hypothetical protein